MRFVLTFRPRSPCRSAGPCRELLVQVVVQPHAQREERGGEVTPRAVTEVPDVRYEGEPMRDRHVGSESRLEADLSVARPVVAAEYVGDQAPAAPHVRVPRAVEDVLEPGPEAGARRTRSECAGTLTAESMPVKAEVGRQVRTERREQLGAEREAALRTCVGEIALGERDAGASFDRERRLENSSPAAWDDVETLSLTSKVSTVPAGIAVTFAGAAALDDTASGTGWLLLSSLDSASAPQAARVVTRATLSTNRLMRLSGDEMRDSPFGRAFARSRASPRRTHR
jgi:hypothetical protein